MYELLKEKVMIMAVVSETTASNLDEKMSIDVAEKPATKISQDYYQSKLYQCFLSDDRARRSRKWHHYFPIYDWHLSRFETKSPTLVEIGVAGGGSLEIWRRYFGTEARIIGVDINPSCKVMEQEGFEIFIGDQNDQGFLRELHQEIGTCDILIDDGGHTSSQCINTFNELYDTVNFGGVYIIEDTLTSLFPRYVDTFSGLTAHDMAHSVAEKLSWWHITPNNHRYKQPPNHRKGEAEVPDITRKVWGVSFYDSVVVFEKRDVPEPWNDLK